MAESRKRIAGVFRIGEWGVKMGEKGFMFEGLQQVGWEVKEGKIDKLVMVESRGLGPCVDGRKPKDLAIQLRGPKIQGGVLGVMALGVGRGDESAVREAVKIIKAAGFTPAIHGDGQHHESGCGFGRLWREGKFKNFPKLEISLERVREIVEAEGGEYVELTGDHEEQQVRANFVENMTLEPDGSSFILDAWSAEKFGIDQKRLLENAVETVTLLNGKKVLEVIK